jgi:hypothetical protein
VAASAASGTCAAAAKLNGVEPLAWLPDALEHMVLGRTKSNELEQLLPWAWKAEPLDDACCPWWWLGPYAAPALQGLATHQFTHTLHKGGGGTSCCKQA